MGRATYGSTLFFIMAKKERINVVYSTNPDFQYEYDEEIEQETLPVDKQNLRVSLDSKQRKGKTVTLISGFIGKDEDLNKLAKELKNKLGVGGSTYDGEILIQGDQKVKTIEILKKLGYTKTK